MRLVNGSELERKLILFSFKCLKKKTSTKILTVYNEKNRNSVRLVIRPSIHFLSITLHHLRAPLSITLIWASRKILHYWQPESILTEKSLLSLEQKDYLRCERCFKTFPNKMVFRPLYRCFWPVCTIKGVINKI